CGVKLHVIVIPSAHKCEIYGIDEWKGALRIKVDAPPENNRANIRLVEFIAELLGIDENDIKISCGLHAREKHLFIKGVNRKLVEERLGNVRSKKT
ncbi:MAG: DUF167 family protein, partial [Thermoplasmata archaeon]